MPSLSDIITGFNSVRAEGSAFVVEASASSSFELIDADRLLALHRTESGPGVGATVGDARSVPSQTFFVLWQRRDGAFGAMTTLDIADGAVAIKSDAAGLRLNVGSSVESLQQVAMFALAANPYVAADFCRAASTKRVDASGAAVISPGEQIDFRLHENDPRDALYVAAVMAIWTRSVTLAAEQRDVSVSDATQRLIDAAHQLFLKSPATITRDRLFTDCRRESKKLLKAFTHKGRDGVLGLFNCRHDPAEELITDTWRVDDVEGLGGEQFAAWHAIERKLIIIDRGVDETVDMPPFGAELIHLVPILQNAAPLGLIDQLNSTASMTRVGSRKCKLADGGTVGWYAGVKPTKMMLDGEAVAFDYRQASGLVTFKAETGRPHDSEVIL